jgi:hypothetical protein
MNEPRIRTILFLAANPAGTAHLRLDQESREIDEGLQRARQRDRFEFEQRWAVRPLDLQRAMLDCEPQIVHFSGHGAGERGIVLEGDDGSAKPVSGEALESLFSLFPQVECVLLNACHSEVQAEAIVKHVRYVIGMSQAVGDDAAITFATAFYDALGAGRGVEFAFRSGRTAIQLAGIPEELTPVLKVRGAQDAFYRVNGTIEVPTRGQAVYPTFRCSGSITGMDPTLSLWLVVEVGGRAWPKENKVEMDQENKWSVTVFEDGAVDEFALSLYLGDSAVDEWILDWLERGRRTGDYPHLNGIPGARRLDRVDRLRLKRGKSRGGV